MVEFEIRRPRDGDTQKLSRFFRLVITDTFRNEGIEQKVEDLEEEIETKRKYLECDLANKGQKRYFLIAMADDEVIGSIEYGPVSNLICTCTNGTFKDLVEVGTVFVHPHYQGKGIGNSLLNSLFSILKNKGIEEFCLDSGYHNAQKIWKKKFGEPDYLFQDYWGEGFDHLIWRVKVNDVLK